MMKIESLENYQQYIDLVVEYGGQFGAKLLVALLIFFIGKRIARWITNAVGRVMQKNEVDVELHGFVQSLLYWGLFALVCVAALGQLGIQTTSFVAILGAAGLAVGLALQGSLSNFASGVLIIIFKPFRVGDMVDVAGESGKVNSIQIFTTELRTVDNKQVIIPNAKVMDGNIINYSATGTRRVDMVFGISYEDDIDQARDIIQQIVSADKRVLTHKETQIAVMELADNSVNFVVRPWVKSDDYWDVYTDTTEKIKKAFDKAGVSIPYPQRTLHVIGDSAAVSGE